LNVARAHVVGQSIGGHYALRFALANPECVHGLALADTLAGIADGRIAEIKAAAGPVPEDLFERALGAEFRTQRQSLTQLYRMIEGLNHAGTDQPTPAPVADVTAAELADLKAPTLLVVGEHDPVAPAAAVAVAAGLIPRARFRMIPDCGHSPYFEQPDAFNDALLEFLDTLD